MKSKRTPARPYSELMPIAQPILDAMPDKRRADFHEKFTELLSTDLFTPGECAIALGKRREYGRAHLGRMRAAMQPCQDKLGIYPPGRRGD